MKKSITITDLIMGAGGLVAFIFSFLAFYSFDGLDDLSFNAWDGGLGVAFASTTPAILGFVMVVWIVLGLVGVKLPSDILTFNHDQLKATWGIGAFGIMLSWVSVDFGSEADKGAGFWLMFIGSLAMAVGAVMALLGAGSGTVDLPVGGDEDGPGSVPPTDPPAAPPAPPADG